MMLMMMIYRRMTMTIWCRVTVTIIVMVIRMCRLWISINCVACLGVSGVWYYVTRGWEGFYFQKCHVILRRGLTNVTNCKCGHSNKTVVSDECSLFLMKTKTTNKAMVWINNDDIILYKLNIISSNVRNKSLVKTAPVYWHRFNDSMKK